MKKINILTLTALVFLSFGELGLKSVNTTSHDKHIAEIIFNRKIKFNDLVIFRNKVLKEDNIVLDYKSLTFDANGGLSSIKISVDCKDGFSGTATSGELKNDSKFGFKRDYTPSSKEPFTVGTLE
jgi:hypothetical protein